MDALFLSRLQFAMATMFHFLFVPLTLGLSLLIAIMETKYVRSGDETYLRMTKFWGKLFLINFALGVVTGITLEFQFGTNWAQYSRYVGDIFGSLLAIEATAAFFLESTFIGVWIFGWKKLSAKAHATVMWLVFIGSNLSAIWILLANGFMQHPVGYVLRNGRAELESFGAVITNGFAWMQFVHVIMAAYLVGSFFVMGISAYHLLKRQHQDFFTRSFRLALPVAIVCAILIVAQGHLHGNEVAAVQPAKLAAMESHWKTEAHAPLYLLTIPRLDGQGNIVQALPVPSALSILAYSNPSAVVKGLSDFPKEDRPPVFLTFIGFRVMVGVGTLMFLLMLAAWWKRKKIAETRWLLWIMPFAIPLPYIAAEAGWVLAEVGRQPWIVFGLMRTSDAHSPIATGQVGFSFFVLTALYALLGLAVYYLIFKFAKKGPETA
jgi:cytochrome bd ubiquinol oxidase subunit I